MTSTFTYLVALHWLPVQYRCQYTILLYVIKLLHGTAPAYLSELIAIHRPSRTLRSENSARINPPRIRTKTYGERRFDKSAATLWNNLPHEIRVLDSIDAFKSKLKTFFLYSVWLIPFLWLYWHYFSIENFYHLLMYFISYFYGFIFLFF